MRRIISFLLILMALAANARQVTPEEAQTIASEFFNSSSISKVKKVPRRVIQASRSAENQSEQQPYYVFNAADNAGFVIISGDTRAKKILGYSDSGNFDTTNMPPQLKAMLEQYAKAIDAIPSSQSEDDSWSRNAMHSSNEGLLLETANWGQGYPYNAQCPIIDGVQAPTGCVATAMAIVMQYHNWPENGRYCDSYNDNGIIRDFDFANHVWNWSLMSSDNIDNNIDNIASLFYASGVSVQMQYGQYQSGAYDYYTGAALQQNFRMSPECQYVSLHGKTEEEIKYIMRNQIAEGLPFLFSAQERLHTWVVDGVNSDDYYHCNWGWDGVENGWFDLMAFGNQFNGITINIRPDETGQEYSRALLGYTYDFTDDGAVHGFMVDREILEKDVPFSLFCGPVTFLHSFIGEIGVALYEDNEIIEILETEYINQINSTSAGHLFYKNNVSFHSDVDPTRSYLGIVTRARNTTKWLPVLSNMSVRSTNPLLGNKVETRAIKYEIDADLTLMVDSETITGTGEIRYPIWKQIPLNIYNNNIDAEKEKLVMFEDGEAVCFNFEAVGWESMRPSRHYVGGTVGEGRKDVNLKLVKIALNRNLKELNVTQAGTLKDIFDVATAQCVTQLRLTGNINANDIEYIRKNCVSLEKLDLKDVIIKATTTPEYARRRLIANGLPVSDLQNENYIPDCAFDNYMHLVNITLPESITGIGINAFANNFFQQISIPSGVETIGANAFDGCPNLWKIQCKNSEPIENIKSCGFSNGPCYEQGVLYVPEESLKSYRNADVWNLFPHIIGYDKEHENIINIDIIEQQGVLYRLRGNELSLAAITKNADEVCDIPQYIEYMGSNFKVTSADSNILTYEENKVREIILPESIIKLSNASFMGGVMLRKIKLGDDIKVIPQYCFRHCTNLEDIYMPKGLRGIGWDAFEGCNSLKVLEIPENVQSIGWEDIPDWAAEIITAVNGLESLEEYIVNPNNKWFKSVNGCLYSKAGDVLYAVPGQYLGSFEIDESVSQIAPGAFKNSKVNSVTIHSGIEYIPTSLFESTPLLTSVKFNAPNLNFGRYIFKDSNISNITFGDLVSNIKVELESLDYAILNNSIKIYNLGNTNLDFNNVFSSDSHDIYIAGIFPTVLYSRGNLFIPGKTSENFDYASCHSVIEMWQYEIDIDGQCVFIKPQISGLVIDNVFINGIEAVTDDCIYQPGNCVGTMAMIENDDIDVVVNYTLHGRQAMSTHYNPEFNSGIKRTSIDDFVSSIEDISYFDEEEIVKIYDTIGALVFQGKYSDANLANLNGGIYIIVGRNRTFKQLIK